MKNWQSRHFVLSVLGRGEQDCPSSLIFSWCAVTSPWQIQTSPLSPWACLWEIQIRVFGSALCDKWFDKKSPSLRKRTFHIQSSVTPLTAAVKISGLSTEFIHPLMATSCIWVPIWHLMHVGPRSLLLSRPTGVCCQWLSTFSPFLLCFLVYTVTHWIWLFIYCQTAVPVGQNHSSAFC